MLHVTLRYYMMNMPLLHHYQNTYESIVSGKSDYDDSIWLRWFQLGELVI